MNCIFCRIVDGEIPAAKVYEDGDVLAFIDIEAIRQGHTLVIPKTHYKYMQDMEDDLYSKVGLVAKKIALSIQKTYQIEKIGQLVSGWDVEHAHLHLIPMQDPKDVTSKVLLDGQALHPTPEERQIEAEKIKQNI